MISQNNNNTNKKITKTACNSNDKIYNNRFITCLKIIIISVAIYNKTK